MSAEQAEVVVRPDLDERHPGSPTRQVVAFPRPAGIEDAHQVPAVGAGPSEDLERVASHGSDLVEVVIDASTLVRIGQTHGRG